MRFNKTTLTAITLFNILFLEALKNPLLLVDLFFVAEYGSNSSGSGNMLARFSSDRSPGGL